MSSSPMDVLVAAYQDLDTAQRDFDVVAELVRRRPVRVEGVLPVDHDRDGQVRVVTVGDEAGRKGMRRGAGVGLVVGLFQLLLLPGWVALGAAAGRVVGRFVDHRMRTGHGDKIGAALPPGSAGIVAVYPRIFGRSYAIEAELEIPKEGAEGVIVADADFIGGFGLGVDDQRLLHHTYSFFGVETYRQVSAKKLPTGQVSVKMLFQADRPEPGTGGNGTLWGNDRLISTGTMPQTVPIGFTSYAGMDIGRDNGLVVDRSYEDKAPYAFTGTVKKVVFDLVPMDDETEVRLHEHHAAHAVGHSAAG